MHCFSHQLDLAGVDSLYKHYQGVNVLLTTFYPNFHNSLKELTGLQKLAEQEWIIVLTIQKQFDTRFMPHQRATLHAMRLNWLPPVIFYWEKNARHRIAKNLLVSSEAIFSSLSSKCSVMHMHILDWMSNTFLVLQTDQDGKSNFEATNVIEKLRLKLTTLQMLPGALEQSSIELFITA